MDKLQFKRMKNKNWIICLSTILLISCDNQSENEHTKIDDSESEMHISVEGNNNRISLYEFDETDWSAVDSSENGKLVYSMQDQIPQMMKIVVDDSIDHFVFIDTGKITVDILASSEEQAQVNGSYYHNEYLHFSDLLSPFDERLEAVAEGYDEADELGKTAIIGKYDSLYIEKEQFIKQYIKEHGESHISPYLVFKYFMFQTDVLDLQDLTDSFDASIKSSIYIPWINDRITVLNKTAVGKEIPSFELPDKDDKMVNITDFRGSYVLIDFWASWCGPCRRENPNVVEAYKKYKDNGFTVLGVSLDTDKSAWLDAIEHDGLNWTHISDLNGWENSVAQDFGVMSIPFSILIDPNGIVRAKNLRGEELQDFLKEEFK